MVVATGAGLQGGSKTTVRVLLGQFMAAARLSATTAQDWQSVIDHHLVPELGDILLWKLTARDCDQLYARMTAGGLGPWRVRCAHVVLHRAFAQAVRWGWLPRNPVSAATRPAAPRTVIVPPSPAQIRVMLAAAERTDPVLACWLQVAVATGARRGEICALRWGDIDLEQATVRIERSVAATKQAGIAFKSTKTGGVRLVSLTSQALSALRLHRELAQRRAVHIGRHLRHFVATELLTSGIDVRTVSNRLGHARTSTTLDIYWAWVPARDRDAADHLDAVLRSR
jgi:integrase